MRKILCFAMGVAMLSLAWNAGAAAPAKKKTGRKTTASSGKAPAKKTAAKKGGTKNSAPRTTWRNRQMQPTPDRYKQIQDALAAKGYLRPEEATGKWDANSVDALKRFQSEQNIEATGKINSLSLIALGLGPKHESTGAAAPGPPQAAR